MIKVLHISHSLRTGGLERIVWDLASGGGEHGFRCEAAVLAEEGAVGRSLRASGVVCHRLGKRPGLDWRVVWRLAGLVRRRAIDLLHAHNEGAGLYAGLAGRLVRRPVVTTRHGLSFGGSRYNRWLRRAAGLLSSRTVCVGRSVLELAREQDRLPPSRLRLIYNGVDTARFRPDPQARRRVRRELGLGDEPVLISVGRLAPEKDQGLLLLAAAVLEGVTLLVVGEGPLRPRLERLAAELGVGERVRFLGERDDVEHLLAAAEVFVLSSRSEGVPKAVLEAMAAGLPVVATAVGGVPEVVVPGGTGLLVPGGRGEELVRAVAELLAHPARARAMGRAGRRRVEERFSLEAMLAAYAALYRELAGGEAGPWS